MLLTQPSGNLFGLTQNAAWAGTRRICSTPSSDPEYARRPARRQWRTIALGFHTGHWEVGLLVAEAPANWKVLHAVPLPGLYRSLRWPHTGTAGMLDSLPFRNDAGSCFVADAVAAHRQGRDRIATCDKRGCFPAGCSASTWRAPIVAVAMPSALPVGKRPHQATKHDRGIVAKGERESAFRPCPVCGHRRDGTCPAKGTACRTFNSRAASATSKPTSVSGMEAESNGSPLSARRPPCVLRIRTRGRADSPGSSPCRRLRQAEEIS